MYLAQNTCVVDVLLNSPRICEGSLAECYRPRRDVKLEMTTLLSLMVLVHIASVYSTGAVWNAGYIVIVICIFLGMGGLLGYSKSHKKRTKAKAKAERKASTRERIEDKQANCVCSCFIFAATVIISHTHSCVGVLRLHRRSRNGA